MDIKNKRPQTINSALCLCLLLKFIYTVGAKTIL